MNDPVTTGKSSKGATLAGKIAIGGAAGLGLAALACVSLQPDSQLLGETLVSGSDRNEIALTFDDGPNDRSTPELLDVLARFEARATFFMIGDFVRRRPELARQVHAAGHLVGNHTMTHPFLATKSVHVVEREIGDCNELLQDVLGEPVRYFRPPFGARRPAVMRCARALGLTVVQWNVQGNDWKPIGVAGIVKKLGGGLQRAQRQGRGGNILLHDGFHKQMGWDRSDTVRATELLLLRAQQEGKRMVTVDAWG